MEEKLRNEIIDCGKKLLFEDLTFGSGGNISIRHEDGMLITPSGVEYEELQKQEIVYMDFEGRVVRGNSVPSSENMMHSLIYEKRADVNAIIHTHSKYINVLAAMGEDLKAVNYLIASSGDKVVKTTPYETFGTEKLAEYAVEYLGQRKAVILSNHGLITCGSTLDEAFKISRDLEFCALVQVKAMAVGELKLIPDDKIEELVQKFKEHGQNK